MGPIIKPPRYAERQALSTTFDTFCRQKTELVQHLEADEKRGTEHTIHIDITAEGTMSVEHLPSSLCYSVR